MTIVLATSDYQVISNDLNTHQESSKSLVIDCVIKSVKNLPAIDKEIPFGILVTPGYKKVESYTGGVTVLLREKNEIVETEYELYFYANRDWRKLTYKRLGVIDNLNQVINELIWIIPSFINEQHHFDQFLADQFIERLEFYRHHIKLDERYRIALGMFMFGPK